MSYNFENKKRDYDDYPYKGSRKGKTTFYFIKI